MGLFLTVELGRSLKRLRVGSSCLHGRGDVEGLVWILQGAPESLQLLWGWPGTQQHSWVVGIGGGQQVGPPEVD